MKLELTRKAASILLAFAFLVATGLASQQSADQRKPPSGPTRDQGQQAKDETLILRSDLVTLDVTVVDMNNSPVMNLAQNQFQVLEDKVPQKIEFFLKEQVPVSLVLTIDTSGSMKSKLDTVIKSATKMVKESRADDEMALIEFKDQPELLEEFTTNTADILDSLQSLIGSGQTAMLDALYLAADYAHKEGKNRRKAVILVTDGLDADSYYKSDEVVNRLREADVQIYLIGFTGELNTDKAWVFKRSEKGKAEELLNKLAGETGGRAFFPKELADVATITAQISTDLRTQYSIGYYPTNTKRDGTYRNIRVTVDGGKQKLVPRHRTGYVYGRDDQSATAPEIKAKPQK
ncbi:MAG TPA: VWA domain-containing protein [Blastocatellia bacterium]|nr:VWA domain-containing protein [Blastocatellia bacterium]